ncbi:hypothetical protein B5807_09588 [Epicoccum nigrum]|uniref:Uncharacterized protein n=1 Tax=Epicoccum nigrum TaxID=105696 RepID=A0A1Y2LNQ1_EPING|nr:hypothetical protein B5807_09588 [Epicoccum nigrum]
MLPVDVSPSVSIPADLMQSSIFIWGTPTTLQLHIWCKISIKKYRVCEPEPWLQMAWVPVVELLERDCCGDHFTYYTLGTVRRLHNQTLTSLMKSFPHDGQILSLASTIDK